MARDTGGLRAAGGRPRGEGRDIRHNSLIVRLATLALVVLAAAVLAVSASASLFFLFSPTDAAPSDRVTVRLGGTPANFTLDARKPPLQRAIRLYLVPNDVAGSIRSRFDPRLHFVGALVPDRNTRGVLTFSVPPLETGKYAVAAWCPGCARSSAGRSFFVLGVAPGDPGRFVDLQLLDVRMPDPATSCPVATARPANGFLSASQPGGGVLAIRRDPDGRLFTKLGWLPKRGWGGDLVVSGERLDGPGKLHVLGVFWGHSYVNGRRGRGSWASAVVFPREGCWRLTGRVRDIALSYVVQVVASP